MRERKVRVHAGCIDQSNVVWQKAEPPAPKCRCKMEITYEEANEMVFLGQAKWVVVARTRGEIAANCPICRDLKDIEKRSCDQCKGEGKVMVPFVLDTPTDKEIVLLQDFKAKTPRVPTIEEEHIVYAYVDGDQEALERIWEYADMGIWDLFFRGAEVRVSISGDPRGRPEDRVIHSGVLEPKDKVTSYPPGSITFKDGTKNKTWFWKHEGRNVDHGRTV